MVKKTAKKTSNLVKSGETREIHWEFTSYTNIDDDFEFKPLNEIRAGLREGSLNDSQIENFVEALEELPQYKDENKDSPKSKRTSKGVGGK